MVAHLAENNFWGQIFWGATQCPGPALYTFGKAKIRHLGEENKDTDNKKVGENTKNEK